MRFPFSRRPAALVALSLALLAVPGVQAEEEEEPEKVETFTVTGARSEIAEPVESTPVIHIGSDEILFQGTARVEDMLRSYPQVYVAQGSGESNGATGTATVSLRAMGTLRTLVLINGRRMPAGSAQIGGAAPDINQIPGPLIEQVDIFTGGAASSYGPDAIAGVINFRLMDGFEGFRADYQYSEYQHHNDGRRWRELVTAAGYPVAKGYNSNGNITRGSLIAGLNFDDDHGNITAYATYRSIEPVLQSSRDYSSCSLDSSVTRCLGSFTMPEGFFSDFGVADSISQIDPTNTFVGGPSFYYMVQGHDFEEWDGRSYNYGPANYFQRPDERYTFGAFLRYDLTDHTEAYAELMYKRDRTTSQIAPSGNFFHTRTLRCNHPFLSEEQRRKISCLDANGDVIADGQQVVYIGRRNVEGGPRRNELVHSSYRGVLGVRGDLNDFWDYDAYVQYAEVELRDTYLNDLSVTRIGRALDAVMHNGEVVCRSALPGPSGVVRDPSCVPWNIFEEGAVTQEMVDYLVVSLHAKGTTDQFVASAKFSGDLTPYGFKSPFAASSVDVALGGSFRKESLDFNPDENYLAGEGAGQGGATQATSGNFHVAEFFAEAHIPLIEGKQYVEELVLDATYRYSDYEFGDYIDTWAFGLNWTINPEIRLRGSVQRAVRAPTVQDLFLPQRFTLFNMGRDPCSNVTGGTENPDGSITGGTSAAGYTFEQCARTGVTEAQWGKIQDSPANQYNRKIGGNPDLSPERGKTVTAGIVYTPEFADGLRLAIDYYKVEIEEGISILGAGFLLRECLRNNVFCDRIIRGAVGDLWLGSNSQGEKCTGQEADLSNCLSGHVIATQDNLAIQKTNGVDVTLDFGLNIGAQGQLRFSNVLSHINALTYQSVEGAPVARCAGNRYCGPTPDLQNRLRVTWDTPWDVVTSVMWRHTSAVDDRGLFDVDIPKANYIDLAAVWQISDNAKIYAGINNLTDREPPIVGTSGGDNGNTYPGLYDALGRYLFMGAGIEF